MKYQVIVPFRATNKDLAVGSIFTKEELGSSFSIAAKNGWITPAEMQEDVPEFVKKQKKEIIKEEKPYAKSNYSKFG